MYAFGLFYLPCLSVILTLLVYPGLYNPHNEIPSCQPISVSLRDYWHNSVRQQKQENGNPLPRISPQNKTNQNNFILFLNATTKKPPFKFTGCHCPDWVCLQWQAGPFPSLLKILWLQADKSSNKDKYDWLENPYCLLYVPLGNLSTVT